MQPILVCESVRADSLERLVRARDAATSADLVEMRLDGLAAPDPVAALAGRAHPVIVTCRPRWEGGGYEGAEADRQALLERALQAGADFADVEWRAPWAEAFLARWADRVVLSSHDFDGMPVDLAPRLDAMSRTGAAVIKIAVTPRRLRDLGALIAARRGLARERRVVVIGMGSAGVATRLMPQRFGSCWTYAGRGVAPGQIEAERLIREFRVRSLTSETAVFGGVGHPAGPAVTSAMLNAGFLAAGIDAVHVPLDVADVEDFEWAAEALDVVGLFVETPLGSGAAGAPGGVAGEHPLSRAVALRRDGRAGWASRDTDREGLIAAWSALPLRNLRAAVLGAGATARGVTSALLSQGATVTVHARRLEDAEGLAADVGVSAAPWPPGRASWDLLVNATPADEWPSRDLPIDEGDVHGRAVCDVTGDPAGTALIAAARRGGARTIDGLDVLVSRTARQFEWWTRSTAPAGAMRDAARRHYEALERGMREST